MSLQAMLAARAHVKGVAQRSALLRHREIVARPIGLVFWELGTEPFVVGAAAIGRFDGKATPPKVFVPGQPLVRDLLFAALTPFAREFNKLFESYASVLETVEYQGKDLPIPRELPQIVVPNERTADVMARLGRRLAYLPTEGANAADPALVRMGRHFQWITRDATRPGSQILLPASKVLREHWVAPISDYEAGSLAALDAWIEPPRRGRGFEAGLASESLCVGPAPDPEQGREIADMMARFNDARGGSTDPAVVRRLLGELRAKYTGLVNGTWQLTERAIERERVVKQAPSVQARVLKDRIAYAQHIEWMNGAANGLRRARMTFVQAIRSRNLLEAEQARLAAEEAIDDPVRMIPHILAGKAFQGRVVSVDADRRELVNTRRMRRPAVLVQTDEVCEMPQECEVWWTEAPKDNFAWVVSQVTHAGGRSQVLLVLQTDRVPAVGLPVPGSDVRFTQFGWPKEFPMKLPEKAPWTHRAPQPPAPDNLEHDTDLPIALPIGKAA